MPSPQTRVMGGDGTSVARYELAPGVFQYVESVLVEVDNTGGGDIRPTLAVTTQDGQVIATKRQGETIPAGDTGTATWALRLDDEGLGRVRRIESTDIELFVVDANGPVVTLAPLTCYATISRNGAAPAQNIATGALAVTTTAVQHNTVVGSARMQADVASTPSRLVVTFAGTYLVRAFSFWTTTSAADFGVSTGIDPGTSGLVNPDIISRRVPSQTLSHEAVQILRLDVGDVLCQNCGQNSGGNIAAPTARLQAWRLGPNQ